MDFEAEILSQIATPADPECLSEKHFNQEASSPVLQEVSQTCSSISEFLSTQSPKTQQADWFMVVQKRYW